MARPLDPVPICPETSGISKRASPLAIGDRWIDGDKVIFVEGKPQKMAGWLVKTIASVDDPIRGLLYWATAELLSFYGFGTFRKLYVADFGEEPIDITPIETTGTLTNPFTTEVSSALVNVADVAHGRNEGDEVRFTGASALGGITIDGAYEITARVDDDNYTITHTSAATSTAGPGGGSVDYEYELSISSANPTEGDGYGAGPYGSGDYGAPTEETVSGIIIFEPRIWNLAQNGDLLYANPTGRGIFVFDPADTPSYQRVEALTNAPTVCRSIFVTEERFLMALGCDNDTMLVKWPDQDDHTIWTPGSTNTANQRRLREGTKLVHGAKLSNGLSGVWSDTAFYRFQYTGNQFVFDSRLMGKGCGLVSPLALFVHLGVAYWMSRVGFHMSGGGVPQAIPRSEDVREFVIRALRQGGYEYKVNVHFSLRYNFLLWCYVADDDTEPGLYAAVSLNDYAWMVGTLERTSGTIGPDQRPVLAGADGYLYQHEEGLDADGDPMLAYIERAPMQIANGSRIGEITGIVTDMERQTGAMSAEIEMFDRMNDSRLDVERVFFDPGEDLIDPMIGGRIARISFRSEALGGDFRMGAPMLEVKSTGKLR